MSEGISNKIQISLLLVATLGIMSGITIVSSLPLISQIFSDIPNIEFLSKMMMTVPSIIIAIFAPIAGIIVDKFGRLKPLYVGIILFVIGGSSGFYLHNFYFILIGRAILGVGVALIMTSSTTLIGDYFQDAQRHKFMSKQGMASGIGGILFITLGGLLAQMHWSYPFAIYLAPIILLPFLIATLYEPVRHEQDTQPINNSKLLPVYITGFFIMILFYMLPTQLPYLITDTLGGQPKTIGFIIAVSMTFNALTSMQYAKLKARFTYTEIYVVTFLLFSIGLYVISQATSITMLYAATLPIGTAFGLLLVNTNAWFMSLVPANKRGKASGILTSCFFLGQFVSPIVFEPIVSRYGIQGLFLIVSVFSLVVSLVIFYKSKLNANHTL